MTVAHADPREKIFAAIADRTVSAALIADEAGVITPIAAARETAEELGLVVEHAVDEASVVAAGDEILRFRGHPLQIALADERLVGVLAKPSGIATAARRFVERANGRPRVVSGASKKLPFAQKDMIRAAIVTGGAQPRIAEWPFHYLDKNFVTMLGGVEATLATVAPSTATVVIQVRDAAQALAAARGGADIVFVDTGRWEDAAAADRALREAGLRAHRLLAFGGGVVLEDLPRLCNVGVDMVDVGRPIVDAPLLDMGVRVIAR